MVVAGSFVALLLAFPSDVVTSRYVSLQAARDDKLFSRGWLPDILPPSVFKIRVSSNLDINTSEGEFSLSAQEWPRLKAKLALGPMEAPFENWSTVVNRNQAAGFSTWHYMDRDTTWVFFCKPEIAYCEYTMWMPRKGSFQSRGRVPASRDTPLISNVRLYEDSDRPYRLISDRHVSVANCYELCRAFIYVVVEGWRSNH